MQVKSFYRMFNKETEYALRGLVYIQRQNFAGYRPGIDEIAREIEAPRFYTAKILQRLVKMDFLISVKGRGGGFYFDPRKPDLTLKELVLATEGSKTLTHCGFGFKQCNSENPCPLHEKYIPIRKALDQLLSTVTIQSLAIKSGTAK